MIKFNIYKKMLFFTLCICLFNSCQNNYEFKKLEKERDSLASILKKINNKYVFDSVKVKTIISPENILLENNDYKVDFYFVAYNKNSYFKDYDTIVNEEIIVKDTLTTKDGVFKYKKTLKEGRNEIKGFISSNNQYGKEVQGVLYHTVTVKKKE